MDETRKQLLDRVTALIDRTPTVTIDAPADTGHLSMEPETVRGFLTFFEETAGLLRDIGAYFDEQIDSRDVDEIVVADDAEFLKRIGASISTELASREVADLALIGCSQILDIHRQLGVAAEKKDFWKIASCADAGLGRAARALIPIESAMRAYEGLPAMRRRFENVADSLEIRRQYGMLWRAAQRAGEPRGETLKIELRKIANRIAILRRLRIYPFLRIDDRLAIRRLQKRIVAYLRGKETTEGDGGPQLWKDLVSFFGLLKQVNNRQELRDHDRQVVLSAQFELSKKHAADDPIPAEVLEQLSLLLGCDDDLDHVLLRPDDNRVRDCLEPLERLREELLQADAPATVTF